MSPRVPRDEYSGFLSLCGSPEGLLPVSPRALFSESKRQATCYSPGSSLSKEHSRKNRAMAHSSAKHPGVPLCLCPSSLELGVGPRSRAAHVCSHSHPGRGTGGITNLWLNNCSFWHIRIIRLSARLGWRIRWVRARIFLTFWTFDVLTCSTAPAQGAADRKVGMDWIKGAFDKTSGSDIYRKQQPLD